MTDLHTQRIEVSPCPTEVFASYAKVDVVGKPIKNEKGRECGTVVGYKIVEHELILIVDLFK